MSDATFLEAWRRACFNRRFEQRVAQAAAAGRLAPPPFYLSTGTEHVAAIASVALTDWHLFAQHRCHSWFLSWGGDPARLIGELMGRGMAGSASLDWPPGDGQAPPASPGRMWGHSGLLGDQAPIAVGYAQATGLPTLCVLGDAAVEEDYVLATFGYAASKRLPILFLVEDNDLSILTRKCVRRSWEATAVAASFGIGATESTDHAGDLFGALDLASRNLPYLINVDVCRHNWHAGHGTDGSPEWDWMDRYSKFLAVGGHSAAASLLRAESFKRADAAWDAALRGDNADSR